MAEAEAAGGIYASLFANRMAPEEIVKEWAAEFKLEGLWGNAAGGEDAMQIES